MDAVDQAPTPGSPSDPTLQLTNQADNSIKELVTFDEVIAELSGRPYNPVEEWYSENLQFMDDNIREEFEEAVEQLRGLLGRNIDQMDRVKSDPTVPLHSESIYIPRQSGTMIFHLILDMLHHMGNRAEMIGRAFLIAAESSFEVLFGQLIRVVYVKNPTALPKSDYSFTLDELANFRSIDDAREALISHKIESLLRESLDEWAKWLKRTVNISLDQVMSDWPITREIFIRRNMLVHTDGRITERYLSELRRAGGSMEGLQVGQSLAPSVDYLRNSLQRLIALEVLLVFKVGSRIDKAQTNYVANWLANKLEFLILGGRWESVRLISDSFDGAECKRMTQLDVKIGGWLAYKNRDGIEQIKTEVSGWDVSGLDERYFVIKKLLLNMLTEEELANAIENELFTQFEVFTHPLFADIRQSNSPRVAKDEAFEKSADETSETPGDT